MKGDKHMRNTRDNLIKLLEHMEDSSRTLKKASTEETMASFERGQQMAFAECIQLIKDNNLFNDIWHIYME